MVQLLDETGGTADFVSPASLLQPWLVFLSSDVLEAELEALQHVVNAAHYELSAFHHAERALSWLHGGSPEYMMSWFNAMTHDIRQASWHWAQAVEWLRDFGNAERAALYQPLYDQVLAQQQRLDRVVQRFQGHITRYCQEWGFALPGQ